jgi:signal transduction histidine kinase
MDKPYHLAYTWVVTEAGTRLRLDELRSMVVQLSRLVEISVTLNSTLDLDRLLQFIIGSAADLLESEAASILLVDDRTNDLYFAAATGSDPEDLKQIPVPMEGSIAGTIFREDRALIINEVASDPRHFRDVGEKIHFETHSLIGVPLRIQDKVTGVLEAVNKRVGNFDESDLQLLSNIASQAAVALNNARLVDALQRAYDELGKLERLKSDFIAIASHELRTPLGLILGYAALLKEEAGAAASEHAEVVLNSALRMRALIEAMTNMNMLQIGSAELNIERRALQPIIRAAHDEVRELIETKDQDLTLLMPEGELIARADGPKLTMAVINLLNNAMRFTPSGKRIWLTLEPHGQEAWIQVRDEGIGIPPDQLERIFVQFYQVEDHMTRKHEGLGLGLAIVRAIVEGHGGRVWAQSEGPGRGATFTIALPLDG